MQGRSTAICVVFSRQKGCVELDVVIDPGARGVEPDVAIDPGARGVELDVVIDPGARGVERGPGACLYKVNS